MKAPNFQPLRIQPREDEASAQIVVICKATGERMKWNDAARAKWVSDLNGLAFSTYYSPGGRAKVESRTTPEGPNGEHIAKAEGQS